MAVGCGAANSGSLLRFQLALSEDIHGVKSEFIAETPPNSKRGAKNVPTHLWGK